MLIDRPMYWQLLDNEKQVQCSEPFTTIMKENNTRDSSTTSLTRTMSMLKVQLTGLVEMIVQH